MRLQLFFHFRSFLLAFLLLGCTQLVAQINKPAPAPNPNNGGSSAWDQACASASFNEFFIEFSHGTSPIVDQSSNVFILELSDANGDFSAPVELARTSDQNANFSSSTMSFAIPTDTRGENYTFRVRSTNPAQTSPVSDPFPMYYIDVATPISIRELGKTDFGDGTAQVCDGNPITLEVYGIANPETYQYTWIRSTTTLAEKGHRLVVTDPAEYYAEIDYGSCSASGNTLSNRMTVSAGATLGVAINPPAKTDLCSGETATLIANITGQGLNYTWYKDGVAITSPAVDDDTYIVDAAVAGFEGDYQVEISGAGTCVERSAAIAITNAGNFTVTRNNPENMVILPSQTITLSVSTTAGSPIYR